MPWTNFIGLWSRIVAFPGPGHTHLFFHKSFCEPALLKNYTEGKSLAIYFGDSQFKRNMIVNFMILKIYVAKGLGV